MNTSNKPLTASGINSNKLYDMTETESHKVSKKKNHLI